MDDKNFLHYLYEMLNEGTLLQDELEGLTDKQYQIVVALDAVLQSGDGNVFSGVERVLKKCVKKEPGSPSKEDWPTRFKQVKEVNEMLSRKITKNDACRRAGISKKTYGRYKEKFNL